jgi:anti-sigma B factor antagonist
VALKMTNREVDGVSVVALDGRIVLGEESNALREKVKGLLAEGKKKIVLNMDNITFIDSAGLGTLVAAHHSAKGQGASLRLCHLGSKFQEVLQITKLLTVFDVYDTEAAAVSSFSKGAGRRFAGTRLSSRSKFPRTRLRVSFLVLPSPAPAFPSFARA